MKKYIIITLVIIGVLQLYKVNPVTIKESGHGIEDVEVTSNSIKVIRHENFLKVHKKLYPKDEVMMIQYTLVDDIDSLVISIGDRLLGEIHQLNSGWGEIYILLKDKNELVVMHKEIDIINKNNFRETTATFNPGLDGTFPPNKEYVTWSYGEALITNEITFNEGIILLDFSKGYTVEESDEVRQIIMIDAPISIRFNK
ncbi:hypothetical protein RI065_02010 [Mycoplasmatota bacterium zrk1]